MGKQYDLFTSIETSSECRDEPVYSYDCAVVRQLNGFCNT